MNGKIFKSSFISILDNTLRITWVVILVIITNITIIFKKLNEFNIGIKFNFLLLAILLLFLTVVIVYNYILWKATSFKVNNKTIEIYNNIFVKDKREFMLKNIANIGISQNIFERIFKLYRIRSYTNAKNKMFCDFEIILKKADYLSLLNKFKINALPSINAKRIKFNFIDILRSSILSIPISSIIIIVNFILLIYNMISSKTIIKETLYDFLGLIITLLGFVFPVIYSILKNVIKYIYYQIERHDENIILNFGLFTRKTYIIPIDKIKGIIIDVSLLSKIFRCYKINIINSGIGDNKNEIYMLFPISSKKLCQKILNEILPEYDINNNYKMQPRETFVILISQILVLLLILIIPCIYINMKLAMIISILLFVSIFFIYFIKRLIIEENNLCIINGFFIKRIKIIKYEDIKSVEIVDGPISKRYGICKLKVNLMEKFNIINNSTGYITRKDMYYIVGKIVNNNFNEI